MRTITFALALGFLLAGPSLGQERLVTTWRMNPPDRPESVHGWMAYLQTLADEVRQAPNCNGELVLMQKFRFPNFDDQDPEVRTALELYLDHDEPFLQLISRTWHANTYEEALGLLSLPSEGCIEQLWWQIQSRLMTLVQRHGEKADPERHAALFAAAKAKNLEPLQVWGRFSYLQTASGCVVYPHVLVELDGVWYVPPYWFPEPASK